jgi:hypothetical protein
MALLAPAATADPKPAARRTQGVLWCRLCGEQGKLVAGYWGHHTKRPKSYAKRCGHRSELNSALKGDRTW